MAFRIESQAEPIPGYKLLHPLGRGGFGEVWKVEAPGGLLKAMKFVYGDLQAVGADGVRAEQELRSLTRVKSVRHPFLLSMDRVDILDGQLIIVMELADRNLDDRFRECRGQGFTGIPREELLRYLEEAADALDYMNQQFDLQHLDIKPQNLFLVHNHIKVADFGLVKDLQGLIASVTGGVTPLYASPETFEGWVSRYSDQYSLAIVYQELATGQRPYKGANVQQIMMLHVNGQPDLSPLPVKERPIVAQALSKEPTKRHASCLDFIRALRKTDSRFYPIMRPPQSGPTETTPTLVTPPKVSGIGSAEALESPTPQQRPAGLESPVRPGLQTRDHDPTLSNFSVSVPTAVGPTPCVEQTGDGLLFPALVIGVGQYGLSTLRQLRKELQSFHGPRTELPHVRLLGIDIDPDSMNQALAGSDDEALHPDEILLTRLYRAAHYLRPRESSPPVQEWFDSRMFYRIPRGLVTGGIRALGRLAFVDNYRNLVSRLRCDLEQVTATHALTVAKKSTGLGLRSNWPRVYVVASLAGGTGSGMFVDLAFVVRRLLRDLGYSRQDVTGLFAIPAVGKNSGTMLATANAYASLIELNHFLDPQNTFEARYEAKAPVFRESGPLFTRTLLVGLDVAGDDQYFRHLATMSGDYLYREMLTPLGRESERARSPEGMAHASPEAVEFDTFGLAVLSSPRRQIVRRSARRLARVLAGQWMQPPPSEVGPRIRREMLEQMQKLRVDPESLLTEFQSICRQDLGEPTEALFEKWLAPLVRDAADVRFPNPTLVRSIIEQSDEVLGPPEEAANSLRPARLLAVTRDAAEHLGRQIGESIIGLILQYLDRPGYRLGGGVEAVRQSVSCVEEWVQIQENKVRLWQGRVQQFLEKLKQGLVDADRAGPFNRKGDPKRDKPLKDVLESVGQYPKMRLQQVLFQRLLGVYLSLRGQLSDQVRELGYYRGPLNMLIQFLEEAEREEHAKHTRKGGVDRPPLLPSGCQSLDDAIDHTVLSMTGDDWAMLDEHVQQAMNDSYRGLGMVCVTPGDSLLRELKTLMIREAEGFLEKRLPATDVADCFFAQDHRFLTDEVKDAHRDALPPLAENRLRFIREISLVVGPASKSGNAFIELARETLPGVPVVATENKDSIVFYREYLGIALADLKQLGALAAEAYGRAAGLEQFTPHTRTDITHWKPLDG